MATIQTCRPRTTKWSFGGKFDFEGVLEAREAGGFDGNDRAGRRRGLIGGSCFSAHGDQASM